MTLKNFLNENNIKSTPNERAKLGLLLSCIGDSKGKVEEDGYMCKDYKSGFLNSKKTQKIIIEYLTKN